MNTSDRLCGKSSMPHRTGNTHASWMRFLLYLVDAKDGDLGQQIVKNWYFANLVIDDVGSLYNSKFSNNIIIW